jgi:hypothetical protein
MNHGQVGRGLGSNWESRSMRDARVCTPAPWMQDPAPTCWAARLGLAPIRQSIMILMARRNGEAQGGIRVDAHDYQAGRPEPEQSSDKP